MQAEHDANAIKIREAAKKFNLTFNEDETIASTFHVLLLGFCIEKCKIKPDPERLQPLKIFPVPTDMKPLKYVIVLFS